MVVIRILHILALLLEIAAAVLWFLDSHVVLGVIWCCVAVLQFLLVLDDWL